MRGHRVIRYHDMGSDDPDLCSGCRQRWPCDATKLREVLEAVEWIEAESGPGQTGFICPWCQSWHPKHSDDCERQAVLAVVL